MFVSIGTIRNIAVVLIGLFSPDEMFGQAPSKTPIPSATKPTRLAPTRPLELRGFEIGRSLDAYSSRVSVAAECKEEADLLKCFVPGESIWADLYFRDHSLVRIYGHFDPKDWPDIRKALSGKFGTPHARTSEVLQNGYGARFVNEILMWKLAAGEVLAETYDDSFEVGAVWLSSGAEAARGKALSDKRKGSILEK